MAQRHSSWTWNLTWCSSQSQISSGVESRCEETSPSHISKNHKRDDYTQQSLTNKRCFKIKKTKKLTLVASVFFSHSPQYTMLSPLYDLVWKIFSNPPSCTNTHVAILKKRRRRRGGGRNQALKERVGYRNQLVKHFYIHNWKAFMHTKRAHCNPHTQAWHGPGSLRSLSKSRCWSWWSHRRTERRKPRKESGQNTL